jgi:hypothetical protein
MPTGSAPLVPNEGVGKAVTPVPSVLIRPTLLFGASAKRRVFPGPAVMPTGLDALALTPVAAANSWIEPTGGLAKAVPAPGTQKKAAEATNARTTKRDSTPERGNRRADSDIQHSFCRRMIGMQLVKLLPLCARSAAGINLSGWAR